MARLFEIKCGGLWIVSARFIRFERGKEEIAERLNVSSVRWIGERC